MKVTLLGKFMHWRMKHMSNEAFMLLLSFVVGIGSGLIALTLKSSVFFMRQLIVKDIDLSSQLYWIIIFPLLGIILTIGMKRFILKDSVGHNVASILYAISKKNSQLSKHKIFSSMLGGILTAGFGGSIGLESPIISSGSALGSNLGRTLHLDYKAVTTLLASGAAGAIAAIFNTPIAAIVFAVEVLLIDLNRYSLIPLLVASSSGALTTMLLSSQSILLDFKSKDNFIAYDLIYYIIFAALMALMAILFTKSFLYVEEKFKKIKKNRFKVLIGGLILGILIFLFPSLYGEGFGVIRAILYENYHDILSYSPFYKFKDSITVLIIVSIILAFLKVFAVAITLSIGGIGGIFAPSLFIGAIGGFVFATVYNSLGFEHQLSVSNFTLTGMAVMLGGVLHAPLTGIFLIAEITGGYNLMPPLMISSAITFVTVKAIYEPSIFTHQLAKRGELITHNKDKAVLTLMQLKSFIETDLRTIDVNSNLRDLTELVKRSKRNIFPVINSNNILVGVILLDDIRDIMFNQELYENTSVRNLMHLPPAYIDIHDSMEVIMTKFNKTQAWNLPVIDKGQYIGFVSKSKMFEVYRKQLINISSD